MYSGHPSNAELPPPPALPPGPWNAITGGMTAWAGPWGISYAANLTSDKEMGLGAWDEEMFVAALRTGKHLAWAGTSCRRCRTTPRPAKRT